MRACERSARSSRARWHLRGEQVRAFQACVREIGFDQPGLTEIRAIELRLHQFGLVGARPAKQRAGKVEAGQVETGQPFAGEVGRGGGPRRRPAASTSSRVISAETTLGEVRST